MKTFYLDEETTSSIEATAKKYGKSQSWVVEMSLSKLLKFQKDYRDSEEFDKWLEEQFK